MLVINRTSCIVPYLRAKMKIAEQDRRFRTRDYEYEENQEEEAKHIVYLARPGGEKRLV